MVTPEHYYTGRHLLQPFYVSIVSSSYFCKTNQEASSCLDAGSSWFVLVGQKLGRQVIGEAGAPSGYLKCSTTRLHTLSIILNILTSYSR